MITQVTFRFNWESYNISMEKLYLHSWNKYIFSYFSHSFKIKYPIVPLEVHLFLGDPTWQMSLISTLMVYPTVSGPEPVTTIIYINHWVLNIIYILKKKIIDLEMG